MAMLKLLLSGPLGKIMQALAIGSNMQFDFPEFKHLMREPFKAGALDGIQKIVDYGNRQGVTREQLAYILATVWHETAGWMQPIREGAVRYGPTYSDAAAQRAVAAIYAKGIITWNYAKVSPKTGKSYYGRGLCQITHEENYAKFSPIVGVDLVKDPDKALEWKGMFRKDESLATIDGVNTKDDWYEARDIINGDKRKNGVAIANIAAVFYAALR
jgi:putative chitinase